jgi:hypothetical protein
MLYGAFISPTSCVFAAAVELREDIARIRQANRLQLKMQRTALLRQGVPPAAATAAAEAATDADGVVNSSGRPVGKLSAARAQAVELGAAAAEHNHVLRVSRHPGMQLQQLSQLQRQQHHSDTGFKAGEQHCSN